MQIDHQKLKKLSVIVPFWNEEKNIGRFEVELLPIVSALGFDCEFLLVDDGSTDRSFQAALDISKRHQSVKPIRHEKNLGMGAAVRTGISAATGDAMLTLDCDLTFSPSEISNLLSAYGPGIDAVFGSPSLGSFQEIPLHRKVLSNGCNLLYQAIIGGKLTAISSIFRLYRSETLRSISLRSSSFEINAEIALKLVLAKAKIVEVPATLSNRIHGESKIDIKREIRNHLRLLAKAIKWRTVG